jgi:uncharacterized protein (TIGR03437 family)
MRGSKYRTTRLARLALAGLVIAIVLQSHDRNLPGSSAHERQNSASAAVTTVSAASFAAGPLARDVIASAFGANLAPSTVEAPRGVLPLPEELADTRVRLRDSAGAERNAGLFYVSPGQINFLIPPETANGAVTLSVVRSGNVIDQGAIQIENVAPGLFTANANGQGVPAAGFIRVAPNGARTAEYFIFQFDTATNRFVSVPIDLGPAGEQGFLILFGTGFRNRSALSAVTCQIGGEASDQVQFAGAQGLFAGLDQANVRIPRSLAGRGDVNVVFTVDGKTANTVTINIR